MKKTELETYPSRRWRNSKMLSAPGTLGYFIQQQRVAKRITREELATRCGYSGPYLYEIESGARTPATHKLFHNVAAVLEVPIDVLYFAAGRLPPDVGQKEYTIETMQAALRVLRAALA